ncbi:PREDICTED: uncharacterized protein LOC107354273 [Acropora digitifera]|uniref:uncharacterized protein LOC107354273 n=1 Tax=Acropora digitifera TaxID=70779 RepID=UPI00077A2C31|nr:PREDICTED: uncharacterized protein LOC107354273 [Acropora digitifera]
MPTFSPGIPPPTFAPIACPFGWVYYGSSCYLFSDVRKKWVDAKTTCRQLGGTLLKIDDANEQHFISWKLAKFWKTNWIGLTDSSVEGRYRWEGDNSPVNYTNWARGQPDDYGGVEDCISVYGGGSTGLWNDDYCDSEHYYICEKVNGMKLKLHRFYFVSLRAGFVHCQSPFKLILSAPNNSKLISAGAGQCDSPFGMEDGTIGDNDIIASSSFNDSSLASQARLHLTSDNSTAGAWCAAQNKVGEYVQIDLGVVRQIQHLALQGRPESSDFVKTLYLRYGNNGLDFNNYGENATVKYKTLTGNSNSRTISNIVLPESINARFIRIYPVTWSSRICLRTEVYGCAAQGSSNKCGTGWEVGPDNTCYQINADHGKIWADARATCLSRQGDLVSITSSRERTWLSNRLRALSSWSNYFWIGLNDRDMSSLFYWSDGSPYSLRAWYPGNPSDYSSKNLKACVKMYTRSVGYWMDASCGEYRPYVCKRRMASPDGKKLPVTGNWISGTNYYWPLNELVDNDTKALGTISGTVYGNVNKTYGFPLGRDTLHFSSSGAYLEVGPFPAECIIDPSKCIYGITVSFVVQFEDNAQNWTRDTLVVDTIGGKTMRKGNPGFAVYVANNRLYVTVVTRKNNWTVSESLITGDMIWQHVLFSWHMEKGLVLYLNGTQRIIICLHFALQQDLDRCLGQADTSRCCYAWSDKSPVKFTRWNPQQPDSHFGQQPCVEMYSTGEWADTGCYSVKKFICKMSRTANSATFSPTFTTRYVASTQGPIICPPGWILWNSMCYYFSNDSLSSKMSWKDAVQACRRIRGGDLVSIHSASENTFIKSNISRRSSLNFWIGLNDLGLESSFKWSDGSPVQYTNYAFREPNDFFKQEDCVEMHRFSGTWNDNHCSRRSPYICKIKGSVHPTIFPTTPTGPKLKWCKKGWLYYESKCYLLVSDSKQTWGSARSVCRQGLNGRMKGDLVTVDNQYEQAFLITALIGRQSVFWIGLNDFHIDGTFYWTDSSPVKFTNWGAGQPSRGRTFPSCVSMTSFGRWINRQCSQRRGYICEAGALPDYTNSTVAPAQNRTSECPLHYNLIGDDCYFVSSIKLTWKEAREVCKREGNGDLISVHSPVEQAYVLMNLKNFNGGIWLGLFRGAFSAEFAWSDHSISVYTAWAPKQPNAPNAQKTCVVVNSSNSNAGLWDDIDCAARNGFICKIRKALLKHQVAEAQREVLALPVGMGGLGLRELRDAIKLRCGWEFSDFPTVCTCVCGDFFDADHAVICMCGGYALQWHNEILDHEAEILQAVCADVEMEPVFPEVTGEVLPRGANKAPDARLDIRARGFWTREQSAFFDVRVYHPKFKEDWFQVEFLNKTRLSRIATQGSIFNGASSYINTFKVQTSLDGINFATYQKNGKDSVFIANRDSDSIVTSAIKPPIDIPRFIRLVPIIWTGAICLRMELYGCPYVCETPLGMQSGAVKDADISASSSNSSQGAINARPFSYVGWCAQVSDTQPWFQISFTPYKNKITKLTTWGGGLASGYVKVYNLQFADGANVSIWSNYKEGGKIRNFRGNQDAVHPLTHLLAEPIITQNLRVKPLLSSMDGVCLRLEIYGCKTEIPSPAPSTTSVTKALPPGSSRSPATVTGKEKIECKRN